MKRAMDDAAGQVLRLGAAGLAAGLWAGASIAQAPVAPPAPPAVTAKPAPAKAAAPRATIQLSPTERQAIDRAEAARDRPARVEDELAPTAEDIKPRAADDNSTTRIEQRHQSNRVSEVIVTPAGQSRSYVMNNREGMQPFGSSPFGSGNLSVPMFFRFEFGRPAPAPSANPPPPPAQSPTR